MPKKKKNKKNKKKRDADKRKKNWSQHKQNYIDSIQKYNNSIWCPNNNLQYHKVGNKSWFNITESQSINSLYSTNKCKHNHKYNQ